MKKFWKTFVMSLTTSRVIGAFSLLLFRANPLTSVLFYIIYTWCIFSDIADGYIARKKRVTSNFGAIYDSTADLLLIGILLFVLIPALSLRPWIMVLIGLVLGTRAIALGIGWMKYKTLSLLHTYSNKGAGLIMACFPLFLGLFGLNAAFLIIFFAAFGSAVEEMVITLRANKLDRNIISVFHVNNIKNGY
ncbi:MAG: CDP-alcohol phosphatidyltransferase family protein [Defluviitaleaceae bacterium]|nr:CDP-alcohol phosphatidyltransferase family protein [Defluviitaleaceae bacterium]